MGQSSHAWHKPRKNCFESLRGALKEALAFNREEVIHAATTDYSEGKMRGNVIQRHNAAWQDAS
jgi:hypothetical protein